MAETHVYQKQSVIPTTMARMIAFHEDPHAINRLTPPPIFVQLLRDDRQSFDDGELVFRLWLGPVPIQWKARHEPGPTETSFQDRMIAGPMASWLHQHIFREVPGGIELTDRVSYAHKTGLPGLFTRLMFGGLPLRILFAYRHLRTRLGTRGLAQKQA
jgi:ligand-binding SRPBCC domain-containing protein